MNLNKTIERSVAILMAFLVTASSLFIPSITLAANCASSFPGTINSDDGSFPGRRYGSRFTVASDCAVTAMGFLLKKTGTPSNRPFKIYNDSAGFPGSAIVTGADIDVSTAVGASYAVATSTADGSVCLHSGTTYYLILESLDTDGIGRQLFQGANGSGGHVFYSDNYGLTWLDTGENEYFEVDGSACAGGTLPPRVLFSSYWI